MRTRFYALAFGFVIVVLGVAAIGTEAADTRKPKIFEGIITQMNLGDGSFILRLRDGSNITVKNPMAPNLFLSIKGVLTNNILDPVSEFKIKDPNAKDAIPQLTLLDPGSGQVGTMVAIKGSGFTKKNNSVNIGSVNYALTGLASPDGKTLSFRFPPAPCNQRLKVNCPRTVLAQGVYDISVLNENGLSTALQFQVMPLPELNIRTEVLPQAVQNSFYSQPLEALGGAESYLWRVSEGQLPPGLLFAQATCKETPCKSPALVKGKATVPGSYTFTVTLTSGLETFSREFTVTVVQALNAAY